MKEKVLGKIMLTKDGIFEVYEIDRGEGIIGGYKCFSLPGKGNPYRTFKLSEVNIHNMRKN